ncbi:MAG: tail fiber domain-containing protein [Candidatus Accumulibacter necessarius]|jgi:hypothetical protein|uniref:tail fiber domain-containing protein n=1 Tax=Candidatus Accumulibacter necessarius TaxID=2954386 RepID=UPI002FC30078
MKKAPLPKPGTPTVNEQDSMQLLPSRNPSFSGKPFRSGSTTPNQEKIMPEQFRGDLQEGLTAVRRRPGALEATQSTSRVAGKSERHHDSARRLVLGLVPFLVCLLFMGSAVSADEALFINPQGLVGIGTADPGERLEVSKGKIQLDGDQKIRFTDRDTANNLKLQLWSGFGLGINPYTLFYAADGRHSWRDKNAANERMALTTGPDGGLTVMGTGNSSFAGNVGIGMPHPGNALHVGANKSVRFELGDKQKVSLGENGSLEVNAPSIPGGRFVVTDGGTDGKSSKVGIGTAEPNDKLDVAGNLRILTGSNPIRFTSEWSGFPDNVTNQAEISNDTTGFKTLMIIGNKSAGGDRRRVGIWDQLVVSGDLFVTGRLLHQVENQWRLLRSKRSGSWEWSFTDPAAAPVLSDVRLKSDVQTLPTALDKILQLRGVSYQWNDEALKYFTRDIETTISVGPDGTAAENEQLWKTERDKRHKELSTTQVGVVAQDVEAVLPEAVTTDEAGYKSVRYDDLIPLLIEALKEQDRTVKEQAQLVAQQQQEIARLAAGNLAIQQKLAELAAVKEQMARLEATLQRVAATQALGTIDAVAQLSETKTR